MQLKYETNGLLKEIPLEFEHYRTRVLPGPFDGWEEGEVEVSLKPEECSLKGSLMSKQSKKI